MNKLLATHSNGFTVLERELDLDPVLADGGRAGPRESLSSGAN